MVANRADIATRFLFFDSNPKMFALSPKSFVLLYIFYIIIYGLLNIS